MSSDPPSQGGRGRGARVGGEGCSPQRGELRAGVLGVATLGKVRFPGEKVHFSRAWYQVEGASGESLLPSLGGPVGRGSYPPIGGVGIGTPEGCRRPP